MDKVVFVTGNDYKFQVACEGVKKYLVQLDQAKLETPEIQAESVEEVAAFSAKWAASQLGKPVVVTDGGYNIEALNGFPGVFIKYVNKWLSSDDLLRLMAGKDNRRVTAQVALAYCAPDGEARVFTANFEGRIAQKAGKPGGTAINEIYIPVPYDKTESELSREVMVAYWNTGDLWGQWCRWMAFPEKG